MKKILTVLGLILLLSGCSLKEMSNTPTKQVEKFFNKYQMLDESVMGDLDRVVANEVNFNTEQRASYRTIMKKHYQDLSYKIKNEEVDGDTAIVTVEIEVTDYSKVMRESEVYLEENPEEFITNDEHDVIKYSEYRLGKIKDVKERVKYTLDLTLTKKDKEWKLDQINNVDEEKIHGIYMY